MPSDARRELEARLADVNELFKAHRALTGGGRGRPAQGQGAAITRAGIVLLAAAVEGFVEDLFEETAHLLWPNRPETDLKELFESTSRRFANAKYRRTEILLANLGLAWALGEIRWRKFSNGAFREALDSLINTRNQIAHGIRPRQNLRSLVRWRRMVEQYATKLEEVLANHVQSVTDKRPPW